MTRGRSYLLYVAENGVCLVVDCRPALQPANELHCSIEGAAIGLHIQRVVAIV